MVTNQMKLEAGLELHEGYKEDDFGAREYPHVVAYYPAVFIKNGLVYKIPTTRFRKYPKAFRQPKRRLRRQRRREYLRQKRREERLASVKDAQDSPKV